MWTLKYCPDILRNWIVVRIDRMVLPKVETFSERTRWIGWFFLFLFRQCMKFSRFLPSLNLSFSFGFTESWIHVFGCDTVNHILFIFRYVNAIGCSKPVIGHPLSFDLDAVLKRQNKRDADCQVGRYCGLRQTKIVLNWIGERVTKFK